MGAELFQLLLELSDGYQLGDASSDDTFSHISIFVQRLAQEDEHELMAWNPMQDEKLFTITARRQISEHTTVQKLLLDVVEEGSNT